MLYTAKCYWPGISPNELERAAARALRETRGSTPRRRSVTYIGSILFPNDELVLCLFDASSRAAVKHASERAGIPCERVMETTWLWQPNAPALLVDGRGDANT
jgi:hypothetical protein